MRPDDFPVPLEPPPRKKEKRVLPGLLTPELIVNLSNICLQAWAMSRAVERSDDIMAMQQTAALHQQAAAIATSVGLKKITSVHYAEAEKWVRKSSPIQSGQDIQNLVAKIQSVTQNQMVDPAAQMAPATQVPVPNAGMDRTGGR